MPTLAGPTFAAAPSITVEEDTVVQGTQWATNITFAGNGTMTFNVTPVGSCSILSTMPAVSSMGVLTYQPAPNAFGQCKFSVTLCVFKLCSTAAPLVIDVTPGAAAVATSEHGFNVV
jgi:hypothetical protein